MGRHYVSRLGLQNFIAVKLLEITPKRVTLISGDNQSGKSSALRAIRSVFERGGIDPELIHHDEKAGTVLVQLDQLIELDRRITQKTNTLTGENIPGDLPALKWVREVAAGSMFDPSKWYQLAVSDSKPGRRGARDMLLRSIPFTLNRDTLSGYVPDDVDLSGIDFDAHGFDVITAVRKLIYDLRTAANTQADAASKAAKKERQAIPADFDPEGTVTGSLESVQAELDAWQNGKNEHESAGAAVDAARRIAEETDRQRAACSEAIAALKQELAEKERQLVEYDQMSQDRGDQLALAEATRDALPVPDDAKRAALVAQRTELMQHDSARSTLALIEKHEKEATQAGARARKLNELHERFREEIPRELTGSLSMPIEGLRFEDDRMFIGEDELNKLSKGRLLRVAMEYAVNTVERNPEGIGFILADDLEALGDGLLGEVVAFLDEHPSVQLIGCERTAGPLTVTTGESASVLLTNRKSHGEPSDD